MSIAFKRYGFRCEGKSLHMVDGLCFRGQSAVDSHCTMSPLARSIFYYPYEMRGSLSSALSHGGHTLAHGRSNASEHKSETQTLLYINRRSMNPFRDPAVYHVVEKSRVMSAFSTAAILASAVYKLSACFKSSAFCWRCCSRCFTTGLRLGIPIHANRTVCRTLCPR